LLHKKVDITTLAEKFNANEGYLNVALRGLCSQGWLNQHVDNQKNSITFEINDTSEIAFNHFFLYEEAVDLLNLSVNYHPRKFMMAPFLKLESIYKKHKQNFGLELSENRLKRTIQEQILTHIEGIIVGPTIVHLGISGMFHKYFMETRLNLKNFIRITRTLNDCSIFWLIGWFKIINDSYEFTEYGCFLQKEQVLMASPFLTFQHSENWMILSLETH